jgi:glycosyltransferase involved in cell wall biosynthesis
LLVDPANTAALAAALRDLVEQPSLRQQLRQRGLQRAAQFSWERTAAATHAALAEILSAVG